MKTKRFLKFLLCTALVIMLMSVAIITASAAEINVTITSADSAVFTEGAAGSFTVTTSGYSTTLTCTGTLPDGVTFIDNGNDTATISGTPATPGVYTVKITVFGSSQTFTLLVMAPDSISDFTFDLAEGSIAVAFISNIAVVTDGVGTTVVGNRHIIITQTGSSTPTTNTISVTGTGTAYITLSNVNIDVSGTPNARAFALGGTAAVTLTLSGTNTLNSGSWCAGLQVPDGTSVSIDAASAADRLTAIGGEVIGSVNGSGAGIGGGYGSRSGTVTVYGGTITATGGACGSTSGSGAGIGGGGGAGAGGDETSVYIYGGIVTAVGGACDNSSGSGAGIGGGGGVTTGGGAAGTVYIYGGTVTAVGGACGSSSGSGAGIGGGGAGFSTAGAAGTCVITGGSVNAVIGTTPKSGSDAGSPTAYLTTVTLEDDVGNTVDGALISALTASLSGAAYSYGTNNMYTDASGKLYLWLPENTATTQALSAGAQYTGAVATETTASESAGVLSLLRVTAVTPNGAGAAVSGTLAVTFSKAMGTAGTVTLSGGASLSGGSWSADGKTYTVQYAGLDYSTAYTVTVSGFKDTDGNTLADAAHTFTTAADTVKPTVSGVTPNGTGAAVGGALAVTFSKAMGTAGAVTLSGVSGALTGGSWSVDGKIYTVQYAGLDYSTAYTVTVSGFKDTASNVMNDDASHTFTTVSAPPPDIGTGVLCTITAAAGTGGSISPSGSVIVAYGGSRTFTITPDEGYEIADVLSDGVSVGAVSTYTFTDVNKAHTITASFRKPTVNPFSDVNPDDWFYNNVLYVSENSLMNGTGSGAFSPNARMTRAMLVTILYRLSGDTGSYTNTFSDVPAGIWYEKAVAWAAANNIAAGVGGNHFAPDTGVTREQLAVMLYHYAKYKGYDVSVGEDTNILSYKDALTISDYAYPALQWACGAGIMNGDISGSLNPQGSATRAEVAAMLERFIKSASP
jgi:hypothetical protein